MKKKIVIIFILLSSWWLQAQQENAQDAITLEKVVVKGHIDSKANFKKYRKELKNSWLDYNGGTAVIKGALWQKGKQASKDKFTAKVKVSRRIEANIINFSSQLVDSSEIGSIKKLIENAIDLNEGMWKNVYFRNKAKRFFCQDLGNNTWLFTLVDLDKLIKKQRIVFKKKDVFLSEKVILSDQGQIETIFFKVRNAPKSGHDFNAKGFFKSIGNQLSFSKTEVKIMNLKNDKVLYMTIDFDPKPDRI